MSSKSDPAHHRDAEIKLVEHVLRLLDDPRLRIDTTVGTRPISGLRRGIVRGDRGVELKKIMSELDVIDRELQERMPQGEVVEVLFSRAKWVVFNTITARLRVICASPTNALLKGGEIRPMSVGEINRLLAEFESKDDAVPTTIVLLCTGGFAHDTHDLAGRVATRTLLLVEPNRSGGFSVWGPNETKVLTDLINPETEEERRRRIRDAVSARETELVTGGVAADRIADDTLLPLALVEDELKSYAKSRGGLLARRLDGRIVLYREGTTPAGSAGGAGMPLIERIKSIFSGRTSTEKKIAFLSERRAALSQQRDGVADELGLLEKKDAYLRSQFKQSESEPARRRIAAQLAQLRKELERRGQMMSVLNQQINVVGSHLHNLELILRGAAAKLPESETIAADAARAEETLAKLQADSELADAVSPVVAGSALGAEEQAIFDELSKEAASDESAAPASHAVAKRGAPASETAPTRKPEAEPS
jgi:hypothetical protein